MKLARTPRWLVRAVCVSRASPALCKSFLRYTDSCNEKNEGDRNDHELRYGSLPGFYAILGTIEVGRRSCIIIFVLCTGRPLLVAWNGHH